MTTKKNDTRKLMEEMLNRKDYLITVFETGCEVMSENNIERQVLPRRYFQNVSLDELSKILKSIYMGFWTHPDLKEDYSNRRDIPHEEKKWGFIYNIIVQPLSEQFEKTYIKQSENDYFKHKRMYYERRDAIRESEVA